jgi:CSLREA domain-containing protein
MLQPGRAATGRRWGALLPAVAVIIALAAWPEPEPATAAGGETFVVNSAEADDDGSCDPRNHADDCTLREAINAANGNDNQPAVDTITFVIPGAGPHKIAPNQQTGQLPFITEPVLIDGYSEDGALPNNQARGTNAVLKIELEAAR